MPAPDPSPPSPPRSSLWVYAATLLPILGLGLWPLIPLAPVLSPGATRDANYAAGVFLVFFAPVWIPSVLVALVLLIWWITALTHRLRHPGPKRVPPRADRGFEGM